jgi:rare lipoprotein A
MKCPLLALIFGTFASISMLQAQSPATVNASFYSRYMNGRTTASMKVFSSNDLTAAHRTLPFGTKVNLTNPENGKTVTVTVTDRGPFVDGREISVTRRAARELGIIRKGVAPVTMEVVNN